MLSLADLDEKRIAVVLYREGERVVLTGVGVSTTDRALGSILRVQLDLVDHPLDKSMLIIPVADIEKLVQRRSLKGCDYCITLE